MLKHVVSNWGLSVLQIAVLLGLTPFVVGALGDERYGVWITIVSLMGFLQLLILGVPMASVRAIAERSARGDVEGTNAAIATCLGVCLGLGALALAVGGALYFVFDAVYLQGASWEGLDASVRADASRAFVVVVVQVATGFAMRLPYGVFDAQQEFVLKNAVLAGELLLRLGLTLVLLSWNASLTALAAVLVVCAAAEFAASLWVLRRRHPALRFGVRLFDRGLVRPIASFSAFALLLNVGALLAFRVDALVIGAHLDARAVTDYDIGNKFFDPLIQLVIGVAAVMMPAATRARAGDRPEELARLFVDWSQVCLALVLPIAIYLTVLGPAFLAWWMGPEYRGPAGRVLRVLMPSFLLFLPVRGVALPLLLGVGNPARPALTLLGMGVLNLLLSLALVGPLGIVGVALGTALPNVLFAAAVLRWACAEVGIGVAEFLRRVAGRAAVGALAPLGVVLALDALVDVEGLLLLLAAGVALVAVHAAVWVGWVHRGDPRLEPLHAAWRRAVRGGSGA